MIQANFLEYSGGEKYPPLINKYYEKGGNLSWDNIPYNCFQAIDQQTFKYTLTETSICTNIAKRATKLEEVKV